MGITTIGSWAGRLDVPDDFDAPLSHEELLASEGSLPPSFDTEAMIDQMGEAMDRMANDEAERLKVARRLF